VGPDILTNIGVNSLCASSENDNMNYRTEWRLEVLNIQIFRDTTLCLWVNISLVCLATQHNISGDFIILAVNYSSLLIYYTL